MITASATGTISESAMAKVISDLGAELAASKTTLSASQLADLKTLAADLNQGESASAYVTYITDALIDGNAANTTWTGGRASASGLGNLAAGTTTTQLADLLGKWFLGTDLPRSIDGKDGRHLHLFRNLFDGKGPTRCSAPAGP